MYHLKYLAAALVVSLAQALGLAGPATAEYPDHPVKLIVSYAAGGPTDAVARIVADGLGNRWKQSVIVENRPGAQGLIGTSAAARAPTDGYTLLLGTAFGTLELADRKDDFPSLKDFECVALISLAPVGLVVRTDLGIKSVRDFIAYVKAHPNTLHYGVVRGSPLHIAMEQLKQEQGLEMTLVPFPSTSQSVQLLLAGDIQVAVLDALSAMTAIQTGKAVMIGAIAAKRIEQMPDVPTFPEQGYPGFAAEAWTGILTPKGTPRAINEKIQADVFAAMNEPQAEKRVRALGFALQLGGPDALSKVINTEVDKTRRAIREFGILAK